MRGTFKSRYAKMMVVLLLGLWVVIGYELIALRPFTAPAASQAPPVRIDFADRSQALDRPIAFIKLKNASLDDAMAELRRAAGVDIVVRLDETHAPVSEVNVPHPTRQPQLITLSLYNMTLRTALRAILHAADPMFTYGIDDSGCIIVTADWEHAPARFVVYDLSDIPADVPFQVPETQSARPPHIVGLIPDSHYALAELIRDFLRTDDLWENRYTAWSRPAPRVYAWAGRLVVYETPDNHRRVREMLRQVRASGPKKF